MAPPSRVRPIPTRISGLDLKNAEQLTRRLLLSDVLPHYTRLPPADNLTPIQAAFLHGPNFAALPPSLDPASRGRADKPYGVPSLRAEKKRRQVTSLLSAVLALVAGRPSGVLVDLCGGCGHVGLVAAALLPGWCVIIVDEAKVALSVAAQRASDAALTNVHTRHISIEDLPDPFDAAVALHACGGASDAALALAARRRAATVVAPCCVGGVASPKPSVTGPGAATRVPDPRGGHVDWRAPRSAAFRALLRDGEYATLARAADFGEAGVDDWRRVAKALLEADRLAWLRECGMATRILKMTPPDCTPKNDVLVAWPAPDNAPWRADELANGFLRDVADGSVMHGLGASEVAEVEIVLRTAVCEQGSSGVYRSPPGTGNRRRKVVHAVAESMGLWHRSDGRGAARAVVVRRTAWWPLFFESFVAIGGPAVSEVCAQLVGLVPEACVARRLLLRGRPHHVTIVSPREIGRLPSSLKRDRELCLRSFYERLSGSSFRVLGLGKVIEGVSARAGLTSWEGQQVPNVTPELQAETTDVKEAYFAVISWPEAEKYRRELGLPPYDFHVTLGFTDKDIHRVSKDESTLIHRCERACSPWLS